LTGRPTLNRKLNITFPIETETGTVHVHSTPISRAVFADNFLIIARAFSAIYANSLGPAVGLRVAKLLLEHEANAMGDDVWAQVRASLMVEIQRLTNVVVLGRNGWDTLPFNEAVKRGALDPDSAEDVENAIVFFTCASAIHLPNELKVSLEALRTLLAAQTTSSNVTEFARSLPMSTPEGNTGETPARPVQPTSPPLSIAV